MTRALRLARHLWAGGFAATLACAATSDPLTAIAVAAVEVTPSTASLSLAGATTQQLAVVTRDAAGAVLSGRTVTWSSSDAAIATVTNAGLATALAAGSATITAMSEGVSGSAAVTVTAGAGATILFQEGFEDDSWAARGWYDNGAFTTTTTSPHAGSRALVGTFAQGATNPSWGAGRLLFTPTTSIYLSYWVRYSANWVGSLANSHPHEFFFLTTENGAYTGPARTRLTAYVEHNYQDGGVPILAWQDGQNIDETRPNQDLVGITELRAVAGCNGNADGIPSGCYTVGAQYRNGKTMRATAPRFMPTAGPGYKGDWHHVEAYFQLNTIVNGIGRTDGIARYWFDGALVLEATNAQFRTGQHPNMRFNQMMLSPYIGNGSSVSQSVWVDDILLATARP